MLLTPNENDPSPSKVGAGLIVKFNGCYQAGRSDDGAVVGANPARRICRKRYPVHLALLRIVG